MKLREFICALGVLTICGVGFANEPIDGEVAKSGETPESPESPADPASPEGTDPDRYIDVEEVVVSSSRNAISKRKATTIVGVATRSLFESTSANTAAEVLNFQPGLRVEYTCSNCGVPTLRINGLEGQYSQILLDSRPIFSSLAGVYGLEQLPESMIERVEVIRGGGSALFGSSAIAGVVNIITREPKSSGVQLSNSTGVYEGGGADINTSLNASVVSDDRKSGVYIFSMLRDRASYDRNGDTFSEVPALQSTVVGARGFYRFTDLSRITLEYHHMDEYRRGGDMMDRPAHEANIAEELQHRIDGGGVKYDFISDNMNHRFNAYLSAQNISRDSYFGAGQDLNAYGDTFDATVVGGGQYTLNMDRFLFMPSELTAGIEYTNNYLHDYMAGYNRNLVQFTENYGMYVQNEWRNSDLSIQIGGRVDKHSLVSDLIISPRASLRYVPVEPLTLRASYGSGFRAPQAYDEDLHVAAVGGEISLIVIDPNLRPEYSNSLTLSADFIHSWDNLTVNLTAEGFYTKLDDVFVLTPMGTDPAGNLLFERTNASGATIAGVNFEARMNYRNLLLFNGGFTLQSSEYDTPFAWSENPDVTPVTEMLRSPNAYGYLAFTYNPTSALSVNANGTYTGPMLVPHFQGTIPSDELVNAQPFWDLGLKVAYTISLGGSRELEINGGVKNALNQFQSDLDFGQLKDAGYIYGPATPRTYFVGAKIVI